MRLQVSLHGKDTVWSKKNWYLSWYLWFNNNFRVIRIFKGRGLLQRKINEIVGVFVVNMKDELTSKKVPFATLTLFAQCQIWLLSLMVITETKSVYLEFID